MLRPAERRRRSELRSAAVGEITVFAPFSTVNRAARQPKYAVVPGF
jgi:hypothetical protein